MSLLSLASECGKVTASLAALEIGMTSSRMRPNYHFVALAKAAHERDLILPRQGVCEKQTHSRRSSRTCGGSSSGSRQRLA